MQDYFNIASLALLPRNELEGLLRRHLAAEPYASDAGKAKIRMKIHAIRMALRCQPSLR